MQPRRCGILMPLFSLPGPEGIGTMGREAYTFIDALAAAGQQVWQILPLTPLGPGCSPYQSSSAFAGEELYISLQLLHEQGLLTREEYAVYAAQIRRIRALHAQTHTPSSAARKKP